MKKIFSIIVISICLFFISCQVHETVIPSENLSYIKDSTKYNQIISGSNIGEIFKLNSSERNGQYLNLSVSYSGGCKTHNFSVFWNGIFTYSNPLRATILITHDANYDNCESYLTEVLTLDLKQLFGSAYSDSIEIMIVNGYIK